MSKKNLETAVLIDAFGIMIARLFSGLKTSPTTKIRMSTGENITAEKLLQGLIGVKKKLPKPICEDLNGALDTRFNGNSTYATCAKRLLKAW